MSRLRGVALVEQCQEHLLEVMCSLKECQPEGGGIRQRELASAAGFLVSGDQRDGWFVAALLGRLQNVGRVEVLSGGDKGARRYRIKNLA